MTVDAYRLSLIEGFEPHGYQTEVQAASHELAADAVVKHLPHLAGFPADITNIRTGERREINLE